MKNSRDLSIALFNFLIYRIGSERLSNREEDVVRAALCRFPLMDKLRVLAKIEAMIFAGTLRRTKVQKRLHLTTTGIAKRARLAALEAGEKDSL